VIPQKKKKPLHKKKKRAGAQNGRKDGDRKKKIFSMEEGG